MDQLPGVTSAGLTLAHRSVNNVRVIYTKPLETTPPPLTGALSFRAQANTPSGLSRIRMLGEGALRSKLRSGFLADLQSTQKTKSPAPISVVARLCLLTSGDSIVIGAARSNFLDHAPG